MSKAAPSPSSLNIALLERLRAAGGEYVPIVDLAASLEGGSDPSRVHAELDALTSFGFGIDRHDDRGAAYRGPAVRLCPDQIEHGLSTRRIGRRIAVWERVSSTNDLAASACGSISNDGLVILADEQTDGRGRLGRSWSSPPRASILMSVLLFPAHGLDASRADAAHGAGWLTALGAVATAEVVSDWIGRIASIKWPNDVRIDGRKIAGILIERPSTSGPSPRSLDLARPAIIGIGLNVNLEADALPQELRDRATSIRIELSGSPVDRSEVARDLIRRLDRWYETVCSSGCDRLAASWRDRMEHIGRIVRVDTTAGVRTGRLVDLDFRSGVALDLDPDPGGHPTEPSSRHRIRIPLAGIRAIEADTSDGGGPWTAGRAES